MASNAPSHALHPDSLRDLAHPQPSIANPALDQLIQALATPRSGEDFQRAGSGNPDPLGHRIWAKLFGLPDRKLQATCERMARGAHPDSIKALCAPALFWSALEACESHQGAPRALSRERALIVCESFLIPPERMLGALWSAQGTSEEVSAQGPILMEALALFRHELSRPGPLPDSALLWLLAHETAVNGLAFIEFDHSPQSLDGGALPEPMRALERLDFLPLALSKMEKPLSPLMTHALLSMALNTNSHDRGLVERLELLRVIERDGVLPGALRAKNPFSTGTPEGGEPIADLFIESLGAQLASAARSALGAKPGKANLGESALIDSWRLIQRWHTDRGLIARPTPENLSDFELPQLALLSKAGVPLDTPDERGSNVMHLIAQGSRFRSGRARELLPSLRASVGRFPELWSTRDIKGKTPIDSLREGFARDEALKALALSQRRDLSKELGTRGARSRPGARARAL